jgi:hypothetical protein
MRTQALERTDDQFALFEKIKTEPVHFRQVIEQQRAQVGGIGHAVALTVQQGLALGDQLFVLFGFAAGKRAGGEHGGFLLRYFRRYADP